MGINVLILNLAVMETTKKFPIRSELLLCCLGLLLFQAKQASAQETLPIIDMHLHTGLPHEIPSGSPALCRPEPCQGEGASTEDPEQNLRRSMEQMERHHIVKAFLSGTDYGAVKAWTAAYPERFIPAPFILEASDENLEQLKADFESNTFRGMGEIGTQLHGMPPNDPALEPYFEWAEERDIPVLIHTLGIGPYMPHFSTAAGSPLLLEEVLQKHSDLRMFVENAGFPFRDEMIAMMYQYPQLYADVSTICWVIPQTAFYDYLEALVRAGLGKRLMFGSDQMVWPEKIGAAVRSIRQAPFLTKEQKRDILYNNAARFLGLGPAEIAAHHGKI